MIMETEWIEVKGFGLNMSKFILYDTSKNRKAIVSLTPKLIKKYSSINVKYTPRHKRIINYI